MNFKYKDLAKKISLEALNIFYIQEKNIFSKKILKGSNDVFSIQLILEIILFQNGNAIMLINLVRLGMIKKAKKLSESLNGYLNIYKNHMMTSLRAIDYFNEVYAGKNCNEEGCKLDD